MTYVESNVHDEQRGSPGCPVTTGHRLLLGDAPHFVHFSCEIKAFRPTKKVRLGWRVICIVIVADETWSTHSL